MTSTSFRDWVDPFRLYNPRVPAGRLMYLWGGSIYPLVWVVILGVAATIAEAVLGYYDETPILDCLMAPTYLGALVMGVLMTLRRLRDLGRSGWMILLAVVPFASFFFALYLLFTPGKPALHAPIQRGGALAQLPYAPNAPNLPNTDAVPPPSPPLRASSAAPKTSLDQATVCAHCGGQLAAGARYCAVCGAPRGT